MGYIGQGIVMAAAVIAATWLQVSGHGTAFTWMVLAMWIGGAKWHPKD